MALYKKIRSYKIREEEYAYYHKIKEVTIIAVNPTREQAASQNFKHEYAVTLKVNSYISQVDKGIEQNPLFTKQYSLTITSEELAKDSIMTLMYKALKQEEDFLESEDV